jgi:hypothetical protein
VPALAILAPVTLDVADLVLPGFVKACGSRTWSSVVQRVDPGRSTGLLGSRNPCRCQSRTAWRFMGPISLPSPRRIL